MYSSELFEPVLNRREFLAISAACAVPAWLAVNTDPSTACATTRPSATDPGNYFSDVFNITDSDLEKILAEALHGKADYSDLFFQHILSNSVELDDDKVSKAASRVNLGMGVRVIRGDNVGYAFTENLEMHSMLETASAAASLAAFGGNNSPGPGKAVDVFQSKPGLNLYPMDQPWNKVSPTTRIDVLLQVGNRIRNSDSRIKKVTAYLADVEDRFMVVTSNGLKRADIRPIVKLQASCTAEHNGDRERSFASASFQKGLECLTQSVLDRVSDLTVERTIRLFEARPVQGGEMQCVLAAGMPGILLHEAIGHSLEADQNRLGVSTFANRLGEKICSSEISIVDDGTLPTKRGSINFDDEASDSQRTVLVEKGILTSYLQDRRSAAYFKTSSTGSGRRQSFRYAPMPRMRVTYMESGPHHPKEILASVKKGLYVKTVTNGVVDIGNGDFSFYVKDGYAIENGKLTHPVKDVNIIGNGPEVLSNITMVGNDMKLDDTGFTCGKAGQSVPVGLGMPTVLVRSINVGGASD